jgi:hypothetical protein
MGLLTSSFAPRLVQNRQFLRGPAEDGGIKLGNTSHPVIDLVDPAQMGSDQVF